MEKFEAISRERSETSSAVSDIQNGKDASGRSVQPNLTGESERQTGKVAQSVLSNAYRTESNLPGFGEFPKLRPNVLVVPPPSKRKSPLARTVCSAPISSVASPMFVQPRGAVSAPPRLGDRFIPEDEYRKLQVNGEISCSRYDLYPEFDELDAILSSIEIKSGKDLSSLLPSFKSFIENILHDSSLHLYRLKEISDEKTCGIELIIFGNWDGRISVGPSKLQKTNPIRTHFSASEYKDEAKLTHIIFKIKK